MGARHAIVSGTPRRCCLEIFITLLVGMTSPTPLQLKIYHSGTRRGLSGSMSYFENSFILTWRLGRIGNSRSQKKVLRLVYRSSSPPPHRRKPILSSSSTSEDLQSTSTFPLTDSPPSSFSPRPPRPARPAPPPALSS